jgi:hypothetical protein
VNPRHIASPLLTLGALLLLAAGPAQAATTTDKPGATAAGQASVPAAPSATVARCRDIKQKMDRLKAKEIKGWTNQELDLAWYSKNCR